MRRLVVLFALVCLAAPAVHAGSRDAIVESRWRGAWVVISTEAYSDCAGRYTNNVVNDRRVFSKGGRRFERGELGKVRRVDVKKSRVDVFVDLAENVLVAYGDGPFKLYREASCQVELMFEVPRGIVKARDAEALDTFLLRVMERYQGREAAEGSSVWSRRRREPYPDDYDQVLAAHRVWKAEQHNVAVQAKIDAALEDAGKVIARVDGDDAAYADGLAKGIEAMKRTELGNCNRLMATRLESLRKKVPSGDVTDPWKEGWYDGQRLAYDLEAVRLLPACFVPVPASPDESVVQLQ